MSLKKQDILLEMDTTTDPVMIELLSSKINAIQRIINHNIISIENLTRLKQNMDDETFLTFINTKISQLQTEIENLS